MLEVVMLEVVKLEVVKLVVFVNWWWLSICVVRSDEK